MNPERVARLIGLFAHAGRMAGAPSLVKTRLLVWLKRKVLALAAQPRVGLQCVDHGEEIIHPDDPFELETGPIVTVPDAVCLDPPDYRQAHDHPVAAIEIVRIVDHEAVGGDIRYMHAYVAIAEMFRDDRVVDGVPRHAALVGHAELGSGSHETLPFKHVHDQRGASKRLIFGKAEWPGSDK